MSRIASRDAAQQHGMVLVAVLWIVAALTVLVTGITRSVREEARVVALARQGVEAGAVGDAVIHLVLQEMALQTTSITRLTRLSVAYRNTPVEVQVMPLNGLIDINNASAELLSALFVQAGGQPVAVAASLAKATIETRGRLDARNQPERFEAPEDLLRVPGVGYDLYAKISDLVTADLRSGGKVNPLAAPAPVLVVLAGGNAANAARIAMARDAGQEGIDTTALDAGLIDNSSVRRYRIQARLPLSDGMWLRVSRSVEMDVRGRGGLPWYTFHTQRGFEPSPRKST